MSDKAQAANSRRKWDKADKINGVGVLIAILGLVLGVGLPDVLRGIAYLERPTASITWPDNNARMTNNTFGAYGTANNIPADSDLWLIVRSGIEGRWYPIERLAVTNDSWHVPRHWLCPAAGIQELIIYQIPDSEEGQLYAYQTSGEQMKGLGINSVPPESVVRAATYIHIPTNKRLAC